MTPDGVREAEDTDMRTQGQVEELFRRLYRELGEDPAKLVQIKPMDGGWDKALSYEVTRIDGKKTRVYRRDLDYNDESAIRNALRAFA